MSWYLYDDQLMLVSLEDMSFSAYENKSKKSITNATFSDKHNILVEYRTFENGIKKIVTQLIGIGTFQKI